MPVPTLVTDLPRKTNLSDIATTPQSNRRRFLKTMGIVGVGLALAPTQLFAEPTIGSAAQRYGCVRWQGCVTDFVLVVFEDNRRAAEEINEKLWSSTLRENRRSSSDNIHDRFSAPHIFDTEIDLETVRCRNGFMVKRFPYYGLECRCAQIKDLNAPEISRITDPAAIRYYGCVVAPDGLRRELDSNDHANYRGIFKHSPNHHPDDWDLAYKRPFVKKATGERYLAYGLEHKTETDNNGGPMGDVILTSYQV